MIGLGFGGRGREGGDNSKSGRWKDEGKSVGKGVRMMRQREGGWGIFKVGITRRLRPNPHNSHSMS